MYLEDNYKDHVKENYTVADPQIMENETILQMIYSLEWYDIPRSCKTDLIEFHPYLTDDDYEKLYYIKYQHLLELSLSGALFTLFNNRLLNNYAPSIFRKRYVRFPMALIFGGLCTYGFNLAMLKTLLYKDLKEEKLDKYFELDLNAEMMKKDLAEFGIKIEAAHFDLDQA